MPKSGRRLLISRLGRVVIASFVVFAVESGSFVYLKIQKARYEQLFFFDIDHYAGHLDPNAIDRRKRAEEQRHIWSPHPRLGWWRTPLSSHFFEVAGNTINTDTQGSRVIPDSEGPEIISTYGDSFTEGLEVNDAETWQAFMAYSTETKVLNFGVSGYGPDQALLALEENLARGIHTPIVILAMINENLNRMMNSFREFYTYPHQDVLLGFKPIFVETDSGFEARSFAPEDIGDIKALRRSMWAASEVDWFYQHRAKRASFPYSVSVIGFLAQNGIRPHLIVPDYRVGLGRRRMAYIMARFVQNAKQHDFTPVFVLLPASAYELRSRAGHEHPVFSAIVSELDSSELIYIDVVQRLTAEPRTVDFEPSDFINVTHPSASVNRAIAEVVQSTIDTSH